ncbi:thermonuclease family protein [Gilvimarinus xylanilyticus]|uniref:Thermonuclease family protein n=1 Tax=Gilvimarinus xylanilyticus TaxID=2944139 RepID=A0A9X2I1Y9_9GAMM|nr:thermonuclease family protein [Gilvimarinus xylanilyticus]MCP8900631.1 thermonuclease family protein [Gilvimarinus xylanilyticus]
MTLGRIVVSVLCIFGLGLGECFAFELKSKGEIVWVADGDSFRFRPDNALMWVKLKSFAKTRDGKTTHSLRVDDRFHLKDMSFLVRVGNVGTAESGTTQGRLAEQFARSVLEGAEGTLYCWDIGYYGRPICSFWTDNWEYGQALIEKGYSDYETRYGEHPRFHKKYLKASGRR